MTATVNPLDSGACGLCACGLARCGVDYILFLGLRKTATYPALRIHDTAMNWIAEVKNYDSLKITRDFYGCGKWECQINGYENGVDQFAGYGFVSVQDEDNPFIGLIESINPILTKEGKVSEMWLVSGRALKAILDLRTMIHDFDNVETGGYDIQTGVKTETALRHFIDKNFINPDDANRTVAGLSLALNDGLRGVDVNTQARGNAPLDVIEALCREGEIGCDVVWTQPSPPTSQYDFSFDMVEGDDLSVVGTPGCVSLTVDFGNLEGYDYSFSVAQRRNVAYVAGAGEGVTRLVEVVWLGVSEPTGADRREIFVDAPDCADSNACVQRGYEVLTEKAGDFSLKADYNPESTTYVYGRDFKLGDIVNFVIPFATETARITSTEETYDQNGAKIVLGAGTAKPDLVKVLNRLHKKILPRMNV